MYKKLLCLVVFFVLFHVNTSFASGMHAPYNDLLKKYVHNGLVDYTGLQKESKNLGAYLSSLSKVSKHNFSSWSKPDALAFLINLYNASVLHLIVRNYPITSVNEIGNVFEDPWKKKFIIAFGKIYNLEDLERIILNEYYEPRVLLTLTRAGLSSPSLRSEAYYGEYLHTQLDDQARLFFRSTRGLKVDHKQKRLYLSTILKKYDNEYIPIVSFVESYCNNKFNDYEVGWLKPNWALNDQRNLASN